MQQAGGSSQLAAVSTRHYALWVYVVKRRDGDGAILPCAFYCGSGFPRPPRLSESDGGQAAAILRL